MKHLLHIIDTTGPGGAETVFTELAGRFNRDGYQSLAVVRGDGWVRDTLSRNNVRTVVLDCKGSFNLRFLWNLVRLIRRERISIIHAHLLGSNVYASIAGFLTGRPVVATFHGEVDIASRERLRWLKVGLVNWFARYVVVVSERLEAVIRANGFKPAKIRLIANGVPANGCSEAMSLLPVSGREAAPARFVIGALGNVRKAKAYPVLVETVRILRERGLPIVCYIAGDDRGPLADELRRVIADEGLGDWVRLLGFVTEPECFLQSLDCYVLCSESEGHPLALTQAMFAARPIVATRCGVESLLRDGYDCILVNPNDPATLAAGITQVLQNPDRGRTLGAAARIVAETRYSMAGMVQNYEALYGACE